MPCEYPDGQDRYFLEYEMRHTFQTMSIGVPLKLVVVLEKEPTTGKFAPPRLLIDNVPRSKEQ